MTWLAITVAFHHYSTQLEIVFGILLNTFQNFGTEHETRLKRRSRQAAIGASLSLQDEE